MGSALIIEDNEELRNFFSQLIKYMGHKVTCPTNFNEGFELLDGKDFDIVVLEGAPKIESSSNWPFIDSERGELGGRSFIKYIEILLFKKLKLTFPVIIVTRGGFTAELKFSIKNGIFDYTDPTMVFLGTNYALVFTISNFSTINPKLIDIFIGMIE